MFYSVFVIMIASEILSENTQLLFCLWNVICIPKSLSNGTAFATHMLENCVVTPQNNAKPVIVRKTYLDTIETFS